MDTGIFESVNEGIKAAMLAKDKTRLLALRSIKKEFLEAMTAKGASSTLSDEAAIKIISKLAKQRKESAAIYKDSHRPDLEAEEEAQLKVLQEFLPAEMSEDEIAAVVDEIIGETGVKDLSGMGRVMGAAGKRLNGRADGAVIARIVKAKLSR